MRLFVGNLPFKAAEGDVEGLFQQFGFTPDRVEIMRDRFSGEPRGFGFAEFSDVAQGQAAIEAVNGKSLLGRPLIVNEARPMSKEGGGGGGRQGGGGGGGRQRDFGGGRNRW
ncbi:MAG TPA: RNA-binding protein [Bryobacteraceae bacterium]|jgi:RNA recognition motif-containing protein